jgi:hypothetical protein
MSALDSERRFATGWILQRNSTRGRHCADLKMNEVPPRASLWLPLNNALKSVLMFSGEVGHLLSLRLRFFVWVKPTFDTPLIVRTEHDPRCSFVVCLEEPLYDEHYEFHRSAIIVQEQHAPHGRFGAR